MFIIGETTAEWVRVLLAAILIALTIWRCGGISVLFRIILRAIGINFKKGILQKSDDEIFYTQKFALLNGVKVKNTQDAKSIAKGLLSGQLSRGDFFFTTFFGFVGRKGNRFDQWLLFIIGVTVIALTLFMLSGLPKEGYAAYTYNETKLQISINDIKIPQPNTKSEQIINREGCINIVKNHPHDIYRAACEYIVLDSKEKQEELVEAINSWNKPRMFLFILLAVSGTITVCGVFGAISHNKISNFLLKNQKQINGEHSTTIQQDDI
ncbi:hypothetical protein [Serratia nevei]|uniref:hypothetical protein n=1 Tax=Serratia nevei TaxID=2703794 RepID=UPI003FA6D3D1